MRKLTQNASMPVALERDPGLVAEAAADLGDRELQHRPVVGRPGEVLAGLGRVDADAFALREIEQQLAAQIRAGRRRAPRA